MVAMMVYNPANDEDHLIELWNPTIRDKSYYTHTHATRTHTQLQMNIHNLTKQINYSNFESLKLV